MAKSPVPADASPPRLSPGELPHTHHLGSPPPPPCSAVASRKPGLPLLSRAPAVHQQASGTDWFHGSSLFVCECSWWPGTPKTREGICAAHQLVIATHWRPPARDGSIIASSPFSIAPPPLADARRQATTGTRLLFERAINFQREVRVGPVTWAMSHARHVGHIPCPSRGPRPMPVTRGMRMMTSR